MWDKKLKTILKGFTLFEILIALLLIGVLYFFSISSLKSANPQNKKITFYNLKETLLAYPFEKNIVIKCIKQDQSCLVFLDDVLQENILEPFLQEIPKVYEYSKNLKQIEFLEFQTEELDRYEIIFELHCKRNGICDEFIIELENKVLLYSNLEEVISLESIGEIDSYFQKKINEVRDAF